MTETLESRAMLAVTINLVGTLLQVTQDPNSDTEIGVVISNQTFPGQTGPVQTSAIRITGNTAGGSPISTGKNLAFNDPNTGAPLITGVSIVMQQTATTLQINDQLASLTNVAGGGVWRVTYAIGGGGVGPNTASGDINITAPSRLTVTSAASVEVDANFTANDGFLRVATGEVVIGKSAPVQGDDLEITTAAGSKAITLLGAITGTNSVTLSTNAALAVTGSISAPNVTLNLPAGATQATTGGIITATNSFTLNAGAGVTLDNAANAINTIASMTATGQDVAIRTTGTVSQTGAILARSLSLRATGSVTLANAGNDLDKLAISSGGAIQYVDSDEVELGVGSLGVDAGGNAVTITTTGSLAQGATGRVVAGKFTANIIAPSSGNANLLLDSANNQITTFVAKNNSAGGKITFVNSAVGGPLTLGDGTAAGGVSAINGDISINNTGAGITLASPVSAGSLGTISLASRGAISQNAAPTPAILTAADLKVVNSDTKGAVTLDLANDVRNVAITNNATATAGIAFKGSNADSGSLVIDVGGAGISAQGGIVRIHANGRQLAVNAPVTGNNADIELIASGGVSQAPAAGIVADELKVTNSTAGVVSLQSPDNDVANLAVSNNVASGSVAYADKNDLSLTTGGGIVAGDSITLKVGGGFTSTPGNVLQVTGKTGQVSLTTEKTASIGGAVTAASGVTVKTGSTSTVAGLGLSAALAGGTGPVALTATGALTTNAGGSISGASVALAGDTSVSLADQVTAATGGITVDATNGPLATTVDGKLTAGTSVVAKVSGDATFAGAVTAGGAISVIAGSATKASDINLNAAFKASGALSLEAFDAITTTSAANIDAASVTGKSAGATTLSAPVVSKTGAVNFTAGKSFDTAAPAAVLNAAGSLSVTSSGGMSLQGAATGTGVTLAAGTATSPGGVTLAAAVEATAGSVQITAVGGAVSAGPLAKLKAAGGDIFVDGEKGASLGASVTATIGSVSVSAAAGQVRVDDVVASVGGVTLAAGSGISQVTGKSISALTLNTSNTKAGDIALFETKNSVNSFSATNAAPGGAVNFVNNKNAVLAGVSTSNGFVDVQAIGTINLAGGIAAGTGGVSLSAAGTVSQVVTAAIVAATLEVATTSGDVLLGKAASNDVNLLYGGTQGGKFQFTDTDDLVVATATNSLATNGGAITIDCGEGGTGGMTIGGVVDAGTGQITLEASSGITGAAAHSIKSNAGLALANNVGGNIALNGIGNKFPHLSAVNLGGDIAVVVDAKIFANKLQLVNDGPTAGVQAKNGTGDVVLTVLNGGLGQNGDAPLIARNASITTVGEVDLTTSAVNDVVSLAVTNTGMFSPVRFVDADDLTIGVGGAGVGSTQGDIFLTAATGQMTLAATVTTSSSSNTVTLNAVGIRQTNGAVTTGNLVMNSADFIDVTKSNAISNLRAFASTLDFSAASSYQVGLDRIASPPLGAPPPVVTVADNVATFTAQVDVIAGGNQRGLAAGDVLVIANVPYRVLSVPSPLSAVLIPPDGLPLNIPAPAPFNVLTPQEVEVAAGVVNLNSGGNLRVVGGIGGSLSLTAGGVVEYVVTSNQNTATGSLRDMIRILNGNQGTRIVNNVSVPQPSDVVFNETHYPVQDIFLTAALPAIQRPVNIRGEAVEGNVTDFARVGIDGRGLTATSITHGLQYASGSKGGRVSGLAVFGFNTGAGFQITSGLNTLVNNYAGIRRDGSTVVSNRVGIEVSGSSATANMIGTYFFDEALANVVGGNTYAGVVVRSGATGNAIVGNYIGTDSVGTDLGNLGDGVVLDAVNGNRVGVGTAVAPDGTPAASNVIANNNSSGVRVLNARAATLALGNVIENNRIEDNAIHGVEIADSTFQSVGGGQSRQANVITSQVTGSGVRVLRSSDVSVTGNYVGTNSVGTAGLGNADAGVMIEASTRTLVTGGNRIAGNGGDGVMIRGGSTATRVEGNWIGTDSLGNPLGNTNDGVRIDRSIWNFVRGGNTIANNGRHGINITDSTAPSVDRGNQIAGNLITANGDPTSETGAGIRVAGGGRHQLGLQGFANVIVANAGEGILVERSLQTGASVGVVIQSNFIGTNANQEVDASLGNKSGIRLAQVNSVVVSGRNVIANNRGAGINLQGTSNTQIGGSTAGMGNVIFSNGDTGVTITSLGGVVPVRNSGNSVIGNRITDNFSHGVLVQGAATANVVVGVSPIPGRPITGVANVISGNGGDGVRVDGAQGVMVAGNSIYENVGLPIAIVNGGNRGAVAPTLTRAVLVQPSNSVSQVSIEGTFATEGVGTVMVVNGRATFSQVQPGLVAGSVLTVNGVGYTIARQISGTVFQLTSNATLTAAGTGRVAATRGVATFTVPQSPTLVGQSIVVSGRAYAVTSLTADGRTAQIAGGPTFGVASFAISQPFGFGLISPSVLNQQFVVDVFLNNPGDGDETNGTGYGMRTFVGRITVTVTAASRGRFSGLLNLPAGVSAVGQYITATATTMRASNLVSPFSTSQVSSRARQLVFAGPNT